MVKKGSDVSATSTNADTLLNQCINISDYMYYSQYTPFGQTPLGGKINVTPLLNKNNKIVEMTDAPNGLFEEAFITTSGPKQIIIGYEGTDLYDPSNPASNTFTGGQAVDDAEIFAGQTPAPKAFTEAAAFASHVLTMASNRQISPSNVFVTGHSLGAAEAEYAAAKTGLSGDTFGTPGIVAPVHKVSSSLNDYVDQGDPVGNYAYDGNNAYQNLLLSSNILHYGNLQLVGCSDNADDLNDAVTDTEDYFAATDSYDRDYYASAAAARFAETIGYHSLTQYATDLSGDGVTLYPIGTSDKSGASDIGFVTSAIFANATPTSPVAALCFVTCTRIRTTRGPCAVEDLVVGDVAVTASGEARPIVWIGHRDTDCRGLPELQPVRVAADAFGPGLPERDLWLSPGHPVLIGADADNEGGWLVPIMCLINGTTVCRQMVDRVTYWHVELDAHDVLLAEELPAESYLDWGDRLFFEEGSDHRLANPDFVVPGLAGRCRPVALDGPVVEAARRRLDVAFATRLAAAALWPASEDAAAGF